jgi:hypothetical protein
VKEPGSTYKEIKAKGKSVKEEEPTGPLFKNSINK